MRSPAAPSCPARAEREGEVSSTTFYPVTGMAYRCLRSSKRHDTIKGKIYIYDDGQLAHFNSRWQTLLLNGYDALRQPGAFEPLSECPFCKAQLCDPFAGEQVIHDTLECARSQTP